MPNQKGLYQKAQPELSPSWQRSSTGQRYLEAIGKVKDQAAGQAIDSITARLAKFAPEDALRLIAKDRGLEQYANEPMEAFRERIRHPHEYWRKVGTEIGMLEELTRAGWNASIVALYYENQNLWSQFDVIVTPLNPTRTRWNQFKWNQFRWNYKDNAAIPFSSLRTLLNKIKPAHYVLRHLYLSPTIDVMFWNTNKWNSNKKWGGHAQT